MFGIGELLQTSPGIAQASIACKLSFLKQIFFCSSPSSTPHFLLPIKGGKMKYLLEFITRGVRFLDYFFTTK